MIAEQEPAEADQAAAPDPDEMLTLQRVARLAGVHPETVRGWCVRGLLYSRRFGPRLRRIPRWAWEKYDAERNSGKPAETAEAQREAERRREDASRRLDARLGKRRKG